MTRAAVLAGVLVVAGLVQASVLPFLPVSGLRADLLLLVVVAVALDDGPHAGVRVGFAAGLTADLLVSLAPIGSATLVFTAIGGIVGTARPYIAHQSVTAPLLIAFATTTVGTAAYGALSLLLGEDRLSWVLVGGTALRVGLINTLLAPLVLPAVSRLTTRFPLGSGRALE